MKDDFDLQQGLEIAIAIATQAHAGQVDKAGKAYITHPLRVMHRLETLEEKIVGVLHDSVEDSPLTLEQLAQQGFPQGIITAIDALTKRQGERYAAYIERVQANPLAVRVKIADLTDNLDMSRIPQPTPKDWQRCQKYQATLRRLQAS